MLEIPEGTVAWRVNEARRLLKLKLAAAQPTIDSSPTPTVSK
jgi:DNA-directed RNA polymerase specialized sigma24 family protein